MALWSRCYLDDELMSIVYLASDRFENSRLVNLFNSSNRNPFQLYNKMKIQAFTLDVDTFDLKVLDQTLLPDQLEYKSISRVEDGFKAIKKMWVRGAPCIAAVGCFSMIIELNKFHLTRFSTTQALIEWLVSRSEYLASSRPTAVNLKQALDRIVKFSKANEDLEVKKLGAELYKFCVKALRIGRKANERLGSNGAAAIIKSSGNADKVTVLTHCNTGALATVGHGTALGVVRSLHEMNKLERAYCTETRPYNQGSRLTAWELVTEEIPSTLIADSMVAYLMASNQIHAVVVGADRVAANGDTANKIGTLQIAVIAKHYKVPFYVAAPTQSIDMRTKSANSIVIEQRPAKELRRIGTIQLAPEEVDVWNPCFDVTPANLIDGIITEFGVCAPEELAGFVENVRSTDEDALF